LYWLSLRNIVSNQALRAGHYSNFAPLPLSQDAVRWYYATLLALFDKPVGLGAPGLATFAMLVGSAYLYVRRRRQAALLIAPIAVALIASGLHRYPFATTANFPYSGGRFVLFAVPGLLLLLAEGVEQLRCLLNKHIPAAGFILIGLIVFSPLAATVEMLRHPIKVEELRPVLEYIRAHQQPRDAIYVYYGAQPAYFYYTDTLRFVSAGPVIKGIEARGEWRQYEHDLDSLRGKGRVWFVFAHNWTGNGINESQWFGYLLDRLGTRADEIHQPGALAYLYDIR